jgi:hypothetical protein
MFFMSSLTVQAGTKPKNQIKKFFLSFAAQWPAVGKLHPKRYSLSRKAGSYS